MIRPVINLYRQNYFNIAIVISQFPIFEFYFTQNRLGIVLFGILFEWEFIKNKKRRKSNVRNIKVIEEINTLADNSKHD